MTKHRNFAGFTLIELLVVIVIIGILATISVATFNNYIHDSKVAKMRAGQAESCKKSVANCLANGGGTCASYEKCIAMDLFIPGDGDNTWNNVSSNVEVSLGKIIPSTTDSGWDKGASFGSIPANTDFLLEFNPSYMPGRSSGGLIMFGVNNSDGGHGYSEIDYAIYMRNNPDYYIRESGTDKGLVSTWTTSDTLGLRRIGTTIEYLKNGDVVYTSTIPSTGSMTVDSSIYKYLGAENIKLMY